MKALRERNKFVLAYLYLARERNFSYLSFDEQKRIILEVLDIGKDIASWVKDRFKTSDPRFIAEKMGIKIYGKDNGVNKKSEYRKNFQEIIIYRDNLKKLTEHVRIPELSDKIIRLLVAYELFEHLEETDIGKVYRRFKFTRPFLGPISIPFYIKELSKVAAISFTFNLLELDINPQIFAYLIHIFYPVVSIDRKKLREKKLIFNFS